MLRNGIEGSTTNPVMADKGSAEVHIAATPKRILARNAKGQLPLIGWGDPVGRPSRSPSMLVERFDFVQQDWKTLTHVDQVLALYLKPTSILHMSESEHAESLIQLGPECAIICERDQSENILWNDAASFLCVRIPDTSLNEAARFLLGREHVALRPTRCVVNPALTNLLHAVEAERKLGYPAGRLFLDGIENALASILVTSHSQEPSAPSPKMGGLAPHRFRRVQALMQANLDRHLTLSDLARSAELSVSHFSHQFRRSMNISPHRYMLRLRIEHSKTLLRNYKLSILDIATAVGFDNQQHYATVFRRIAGVSPSHYRQNA